MPDGDPYVRMVSVMRGESAEVAAGETGGAVKMRLGTVARREPLEVIVAGTSQPAEALKINERLMKGAKWKTEITSQNSSFGHFTGPISVDGTLRSNDVIIGQAEQEQLEIDLDVGDTVLLLTENDQIFYILMKVVGAV